ncbi:MAG TPA: neutral/alkaline non-lysosomal ceramidase N-terminal domain-containing protein [Terracidiphilus sp.]|nr:neutral/alkaline non-lysosomal ceramidase N-terminal domain-containing protein [Terracidiphilus sp.]
MRFLALLLLVAQTAYATSLRAGAAQVDITPPVGAPMAGYYVPRVAEGVHDRLYVKAIVIEKDGVRAAFAACDLALLPRNLSQQARQLIQQQTGIAPDHVMISATHDHTGPVILQTPSRYNLTGKMLQITRDYTNALPGRIAQAVEEAASHLQPAVIRAGIGRETTLAFNRRYFMKNGTVGWNPGKLNPNILRPAGPTDPTIPVLYIETPDGNPIASYVNFSMHQDTTGGLKFSEDFSYALGKILQMAKGKDLVSMFTIGCAGDINHLDFSRKEKQESYHEAARIGAVLAGDVLKVIQRAPEIPIDKISVSDQELHLELPHFTPEEVAWARRTQATYGTASPAPFLDLVRAAKIIDIADRHGKPFDAEVQVIALGPQIAFASFPGEMFTQFGMNVKQDSPFPITITPELANGDLGYIPNRQAYPEGAYEVVSTRLKPGAGEKLMNSALDQLQQLFREQQSADERRNPSAAAQGQP